MEGRFLLVSAHCTLVVVHGQSDSIPDSIAACGGLFELSALEHSVSRAGVHERQGLLFRARSEGARLQPLLLFSSPSLHLGSSTAQLG